jgi:hypothetical protein
VPAPWLLAMLTIARLLFKGRKIAKIGLLALIWSFVPRAVKIATAGFALAAVIVVVGAVAAVTLLALQIS